MKGADLSRELEMPAGMETLSTPSFSPPENAIWLNETNDITRMFLAAGRIPDMVNIAGGLPEASLYPHEELAEISNRVLLDNPGDCLNYPPIDGLPQLRDCIAERYTTTDLKLTRDNVLILTGGMQGLDLVGKGLVNPGDKIAVQSPAYLGALDAWKPRMPQLDPFFPDANDFQPAKQFHNAKFAYTVPNFSNPTGKLVGVAQREAMIEAALECGSWILEDDPYGALFYDHEPLPRMIDLWSKQNPGEYRGPILYLGTFSKQVAPGLRVGWIIGPPDMIETLTIVKQGSDMCTSGLSQMIAQQAYEEGLPDRILPEILDTYRTRRDALCDAMTESLNQYFYWEKPVGGMFVWATAKQDIADTDRLLEDAMAEKVCISPSSAFDPLGTDRSSVRLNFTFTPPQRLREGARRLAVAMERHLERQRSNS
ncbi:MAG: PLP-dependent aminotransferase family protein [Pseudomonadota bacterium]